jgi:hypothetical protein
MTEKIPETVREIALRLLASPALEGYSSGRVRVRFNHYNKTFPIYNGVLKWTDVDDQYSFSFVYRGNYGRDLYRDKPFDQHRFRPPAKSSDTSSEPIQTSELELPPGANTNEEQGQHENEEKITRDDLGDYFIGLKDGEEVRAYVVEDPIAGIGAEGMRIYTKSSTANGTGTIASSDDRHISPSNISNIKPNANADANSKCDCKSGNRAVSDITNELLRMDVKDLHSDRARELREQRDIEDVLFSTS